ncbi:MAG: hypothetical protein QOD92_2359 [Acidimicrobiaceae bacterium]|jgi:hypothetical protein
MDPKVVLVTTWVLAGLVVAAYIWFVVWRFRVEKRKKEAQDVTDAAMSDAIAKTAKTAAAASAAPVPSPAATPTPAPPTPVVEAIQPIPEATVASYLSGISLPHDLVPLTTMLARPAVGDRVAFWTDRAPAEIVGPAFAAELERLGYTVQPLDERTLSAQRDGARLLVMIHADGASAVIGDQLAFSTVPEHSVVIETWVPA